MGTSEEHGVVSVPKLCHLRELMQRRFEAGEMSDGQARAWGFLQCSLANVIEHPDVPILRSLLECDIDYFERQ